MSLEKVLLASILGVKVIALFGPTDPMLWKPYGNRMTIIYPDIDCAPCEDKNSKTCLEKKCLFSISVERTYMEMGKSLFEQDEIN